MKVIWNIYFFLLLICCKYFAWVVYLKYLKSNSGSMAVCFFPKWYWTFTVLFLLLLFLLGDPLETSWWSPIGSQTLFWEPYIQICALCIYLLSVAMCFRGGSPLHLACPLPLSSLLTHLVWKFLFRFLPPKKCLTKLSATRHPRCHI